MLHTLVGVKYRARARRHRGAAAIWGRMAATVAQVATRSRRARTWGRFAQRTIDRRYCGILAAAFIAGPAHVWFPVAMRAAGGRPSAHVWQPFQAPARCLWCGGPMCPQGYCPCSTNPARFAHV